MEPSTTNYLKVKSKFSKFHLGEIKVCEKSTSVKSKFRARLARAFNLSLVCFRKMNVKNTELRRKRAEQSCARSALEPRDCLPPLATDETTLRFFCPRLHAGGLRAHLCISDEVQGFQTSAGRASRRVHQTLLSAEPTAPCFLDVRSIFRKRHLDNHANREKTFNLRFDLLRWTVNQTGQS